MKKTRRISLSFKVNILIVALVLMTSMLMLVISEITFRQAVFEPDYQRMENARIPMKQIEPYITYFWPYVGSEELRAAVAEAAEDSAAVAEWMKQQPPMEPGSGSTSMMDDWDDFSMLLGAARSLIKVDALAATMEKDGTTYVLCYNDENSVFLAYMRSDEVDFGQEEEDFLSPEEYAATTLYRDSEGTEYLVRCIRIDIEGGGTLNLWLFMNVTEQHHAHARFILRSVLLIVALTLLATAVSMLLMRRSVTRPIRSLAEATEAFVPEEDGTYSSGKISRVEIRTRDEIGELSRGIRAMQEGIVENTENLARMTAEKERVSTELGMAARIQANALPNVFPAFPEREEFGIFASMDPAKEVGGDFYDFFLIDDTHLGVVMADVSDKGVPAALYMMTAKTLVQIYAKTGLSPAQVMQSTNDWLRSNNRSGMFVTVWFGILDTSTGRITAVNAGHELPALKQGNGKFELLNDRHGIMAGAVVKARYTEYEIRMEPGSRLFLYTDGVPEAQRPDGEMFGTDRMLLALNRDPDAPAEQLLSNVRRAVDDFVQGATQFDDMTMLCLDFRKRS